MEDDKIKEMFAAFNPELPPANDFMERLRHNMEAVEMIRRRQAQLRRQGRKAVAIASLAGFAAGMLFSMMLPWIGATVERMQLASHAGTWANMLADNYVTISWSVIAAITVFTAINVYEIAIAMLRPGSEATNRI